MDGAGRVVVPKALRDAMHLRPGQDIDVVYTDGRLEIEVAPTSVRLERRGRVLVAVSKSDSSVPLVDEVVRETVEQTRR